MSHMYVRKLTQIARVLTGLEPSSYVKLKVCFQIINEEIRVAYVKPSNWPEQAVKFLLD